MVLVLIIYSCFLQDCVACSTDITRVMVWSRHGKGTKEIYFCTGYAGLCGNQLGVLKASKKSKLASIYWNCFLRKKKLARFQGLVCVTLQDGAGALSWSRGEQVERNRLQLRGKWRSINRSRLAAKNVKWATSSRKVTWLKCFAFDWLKVSEKILL